MLAPVILTLPNFVSFDFCLIFFGSISADSSLFGPLLSHIDLYDCVNSLLKFTAPTIGLSPAQLLLRGLRTGTTAHIRDSGGSDADAKLTSGWRSDAHNLYKQANLAASDRCALAMHNALTDSFPLTHHVHSTAAPPHIVVYIMYFYISFELFISSHYCLFSSIQYV